MGGRFSLAVGIGSVTDNAADGDDREVSSMDAVDVVDVVGNPTL